VHVLFVYSFFSSLKLRSANMTLRAVFSMSKLCSGGFVLAPHGFTAARNVYFWTLFSRRWLTASAAAMCSAETADTDNSEVNKKRTIRWLPRNKRVRFRRNSLPVAEQRNDPSSSVLVEMLASRDDDSSDPHDASMDTVRTEIDEKLKELEEMSNIEIRDIDLALEMEDDTDSSEEDSEKTEV